MFGGSVSGERQDRETVDVRASGYWNVRAEMLKALRLGDDDALLELARRNPQVYRNLTQQAKNDSRKRYRG